MTQPVLTAWETVAFTRFIHELTGMVLDRSKAYLVETRLGGLLSTLGCGTYSELFYKVRHDAALKNLVIDRITTQDTGFFRDQGAFEMLQLEILPQLIAARRQYPGQPRVSLRVWSAGCSTGQEAYSIAIAIKDLLGDLSPYALEILGTDISQAAVDKASKGIYSTFEIERGLSEATLLRHFKTEGDQFRISDELRPLVSFRKLNLHEDFAALGRWDIIFCRNVAVDFSEADKKNLFDRFHTALLPDGVLVIGATESLLGLCPQYKARRHLRSVFYAKAP